MNDVAMYQQFVLFQKKKKKKNLKIVAPLHNPYFDI